MTRAEVIAMARGVGIWCTLTDVACAIDALERFAALVAAKEREAGTEAAKQRQLASKTVEDIAARLEDK